MAHILLDGILFGSRSQRRSVARSHAVSVYVRQQHNEGENRMTTLKTRTLGKSGIAVTEIGMGLWAAGGDVWGPTDDQAVLEAIDFALDMGITFFDTADVYGLGHSEEL